MWYITADIDETISKYTHERSIRLVISSLYRRIRSPSIVLFCHIYLDQCFYVCDENMFFFVFFEGIKNPPNTNVNTPIQKWYFIFLRSICLWYIFRVVTCILCNVNAIRKERNTIDILKQCIWIIFGAHSDNTVHFQ